MSGINISSDVTKHLSKEIITRWVADKFLLPIEDIHSDLMKVFSQEELLDLEADYIAFEIIREHPGTVIPADFLNKISAIVAINVNPYEYTTDVIGFINVIAVCNDFPMFDINVQWMSPSHISRTLTVVNKITPEDMNLDDVYFHNNIQNYIFECYYKDSYYFLDERLGEYYVDFLNNSSLPKETTMEFLNIKSFLPDILDIVKDLEGEIIDIFEKYQVDGSLEGLLLGIADQEVSGIIKDNLQKFVLYKTYDMYYDKLYKQAEKDKNGN